MSEALAEILEDEQAMEEEPAVLDDASAEMMLEAIREANDEYDRMEAWYAHQLEILKTKRDRTVQWAEASLRAYFDLVPTHDTKTKRTYELPGATLTLAKQEPKYETKDEELVPWLEKAGRADLVKVRKEAEWGKLKKQIKIKVLESGKIINAETGEIIPGAYATIREDKFTVKIK